MINQLIVSPAQSGKTSFIEALAAGYLAKGKSVVIVVASDGDVFWFKNNRTMNVQVSACVISQHDFVRGMSVWVKANDCILFDDAAQCNSRKGNVWGLLQNELPSYLRDLPAVMKNKVILGLTTL